MEEGNSKNMRRASRRKSDWHHAVHKKHLSAYYCRYHDWYNNLHQYSKGKIHCSCPLCAAKTRGLKQVGTSENWKLSDKRKLKSMDEEIEENINDLCNNKGNIL